SSSRTGSKSRTRCRTATRWSSTAWRRASCRLASTWSRRSASRKTPRICSRRSKRGWTVSYVDYTTARDTRNGAPYVILPKERDPRLITIRRGGTLLDSHHQLLALWAAACAEHVLHFFEDANPG